MYTMEQIREWGISDAEETFREEPLQHWKENPVDPDHCPEPEQSWLSDRLHRDPTEVEWVCYRLSYQSALLHASLYVYRHFDPNHPGEPDDPMSHYDEVFDQAIAVIEKLYPD